MGTFPQIDCPKLGRLQIIDCYKLLKCFMSIYSLYPLNCFSRSCSVHGVDIIHIYIYMIVVDQLDCIFLHHVILMSACGSI